MAARSSRRLFFVSPNELEIAAQNHIGTPARRLVVGNGVRLDEFDPEAVTQAETERVRVRYGIPDTGLVIGTVARLVERKGVDVLIRAAAEAMAVRSDVHLLIVGGGPLQTELEGLASHHSIETTTTFTGFIDDQADMAPLYALMDMFCLPTRREGYGMAIVEAMAMGKPVVVSAIAPVNDLVIDGETGFLAAVDDPSGFASRLSDLLGDRALRQSVGAAARGWALENADYFKSFIPVIGTYLEMARGARPIARPGKRRGLRSRSRARPSNLDVVIVGAAKCGTSSLQAAFAQHPAAWVQSRSEMMFFIDDDEYERGMDAALARYFGEGGDLASVSVAKLAALMHYPAAVERLRVTSPDAHLIVLLRNPVDRAYSAYWYSATARSGGSSFRQGYLGGADRHSRLVDPGLCDYLGRGLYAQQLTALFAAFPTRPRPRLPVRGAAPRPRGVPQEISRCGTAERTRASSRPSTRTGRPRHDRSPLRRGSPIRARPRRFCARRCPDPCCSECAIGSKRRTPVNSSSPRSIRRRGSCSRTTTARRTGNWPSSSVGISATGA